MATRKKSIASSGPHGGLPQIDTGVVNTLLKKQGSQAVPLYQQCTAITSRLSRVYDFESYLALGRRASTIRAEDAQQQSAASVNSDISIPLPSTATSRRSVDPVQGLWDCLALGAPLCFLFNLLDIPSELRINSINLDPAEINIHDIKAAKQCVAKFVVGLTKLRESPQWSDLPELFTVGDLINEPRNTNGFVKVVTVVAHLIDHLPEHCLMEEPEAPESPVDEPLALLIGEDGQNKKDPDAIRKQVCAEILNTERSFVRDLEVMQNYASALRQRGIVSPDDVHNLLLNVNELLDAQRRFLIAMEGVCENKWPDQRWGNLWVSNENLFVVYEPFCANFSAASELLVSKTDELMPLADMIHPKSELPAFLIKPIQRITKYPLLLEELKRRVSPETYQHYQDLETGILAARRIADRINEAERKSQNYMTCKALQKRVIDWKGHHISGFGQLRLDDLFTVNKSDVDRDYHVFLFDRIILCCKEAVPPEGSDRNSTSGKKGGKSNSLLSKKNSTANSALPPPSLGASAKKRTTPLLLKGRIFLSNVTKAQGHIDKNEGRYGLEVWWRGDEDLEFFTLRCRTEEQMRMWETNVNQLVQLEQQKQKAERALRAAERERNGGVGGRSSSSASLASRPSMSSLHMHSSYDGSMRHAQQHPPMPQYPVSQPQRQHHSHGPSSSREHLLHHQQSPHQSMPAGPHARGTSVSSSNGGARSKDLTKYFGASQIPMIAPPSSAAGARFGGSPARDGLEEEDDFDELGYSPTFEDQTILPRRTQRAVGSDYGDNSRGRVYPRSTSALGGRMTPVPVPQHQQQQRPPPQRPPLRSQFSSVRLGDAYSEQEQDAHELALARARAATTGGQAGLPHRGAPSPSLGVQQQRTRATSTPAQAHANAAMQRHNAPPPLPHQSQSRYPAKSNTTMSNASTMATSVTGHHPWSAAASRSSLADMTSVTTATTEEKRGSGSSQFSGASHGESSGYSTNDQGSTSPLTPYGSSDSNTGSVLRQTKGMVASAMTPMPAYGHQRYGSMSSQQAPTTGAGLPLMKIKVHYRQDLFIIAVSRDVSYDDLAEKVGKKIRLCGGDRAPDAPLRIKYRDDDGDLISIGSDEDVQMAFDTDLPMIALWVQ